MTNVRRTIARVALVWLLALSASQAAMVPHYVTATGTATWSSSTLVTLPCSISTALAGATAGSHVYVLGPATYTIASTWAMANSGTPGSPIVFDGVTSFSTLSSSYVGRVNGSGDIITSSMPVFSFNNGVGLYYISKTNIVYNAVSFSGSIDGNLLYPRSGTNSIFANCAIVNSSNGTSARGLVTDGPSSLISNCDVFCTGNGSQTAAATIGGDYSRIYGIRAKNLSASASCIVVGVNGWGSGISRATILASAGRGIVFGNYNGYAIHCTVYGQAVVGISEPNSAQNGSPIYVANNIFLANTMAIYNPYYGTAPHDIVSENNLYHTNTSTNLGYGNCPERGRIDADPLVMSAATGDFRLLVGSPARSAATDGSDIGAVQHADPSQPAASDVRSGTGYNDGYTTGTMSAGGGWFPWQWRHGQ
jgi:hypothetical protein